MNIMENLTQVTPRQGIITFDNGQRIKAEFYIKPRRWYSYEDYEKELVAQWNKSQPRAAHKVVSIHLMRN